MKINQDESGGTIAVDSVAMIVKHSSFVFWNELTQKGWTSHSFLLVKFWAIFHSLKPAPFCANQANKSFSDFHENTYFKLSFDCEQYDSYRYPKDIFLPIVSS